MLPKQLLHFIAVANAGSFSGAARQMGISPAAMSMAITTLEKNLEIRLFSRSTHSVQLTAEGESFYDKISPLVAEIATQLEYLKQQKDNISGTIKINLPYEMGLNFIYPYLLEFQCKYPEIILDLHFSDKVLDLIEHKFDIGVGNNINGDSQLIARRLREMRLVTVTTTAYLQDHLPPKNPDDLSGHNCIAYRSPSSGRVTPWLFLDQGRIIRISPHGTLVLNSSSAIVHAVLAGKGIATVPYDYVSAAIHNGQCIQLLPQFEPKPKTLWLYYPSRKFLSSRVKQLISWLTEE
ncbi:D-malate degradation protein R [Cedecea neteri]|uniref:D-malate degradation protein R n=1 Tax=Cedecea neteri TaxID=158822 RepID=A0A291E626_9ENTR|nr:LysR family transcriptional regulator [Cedecea neteri]ATF95372.1 LysR family transcriptional regulator [Cedecea neteri]SQC91976.1 D-malate degradation protein R [Cedecea neteri]